MRGVIMSREKLHDVIKIIERAKLVLGVKTDTELANILEIKQPTVSSWRKRGNIDLISIIKRCDNVNMDWLIFGRGEMYKDGQANTVRGKILKMLDDMDEDQQRDILKSIEKEKFIEERMNEYRRAS